MPPLEALVQRSFAAGELAPALAAHADLAAYQQGLRTCRNFIVQRHGGATNRPGTRFAAEVKTSANATFLLPFNFAGQGYALEVGAGYFRFYKAGARVQVAGVAAWNGATAYVAGDLAVSAGVHYYAILAHTNHVPPNATYWYPLTGTLYEVPTPFLADLIYLRATQEGAVVTFTHQNYAPHELRWAGDTAWTLVPITTTPSLAAPAAPAGVAGAAGTRTFAYQVTAVKAETYEESLPTAAFTIAAAADPTPAAPHALAWSAVAGAAEYRVYGDPFGNGTFGYLNAATAQLTFQDAGFVPDFNLTPPTARVLFASTNNYPHCSTYYQQRRVFANTHTNGSTAWASRIGHTSNFAIRSPLQDDDAVTWAPLGALGIQHLLGLVRLIMLTDTGIWAVMGDDAGVLTPTAIHPEQIGYAGAAAAPVPVVIGETIIYVQFLSRVVRDLKIAGTGGGQSRDLTVLSAHLFTRTVLRIAYADIPHSVVWCVRDDGVLLGLTYLPEFEVFGWHRHDTGAGGVFEDVCVIPEGDEHAVYVIVRRTINGASKRYVERFASRRITTYNTDACFVDCGVTYSGAAATVITGLAHLEGASVMALADGVVRGPFTVTGGQVTLPVAAAVVHVGLPITAQLETLTLDVAGTGLRAQRKRVVAVDLVVEASARGAQIGPDVAHLERLVAQAWDAAAPFTGQASVNTPGRFTKEGRFLIQHTDPTPFTVLAVVPQLEIGG